MLTDQIEDFYIKTTPGMNNKSEELELNGRQVRLAQNCRFEDEPGAVTKRPPIAYYNTTPISGVGGILGLYRYYGKANVKEICAYDNKVYVGNDNTGLWTEIRTLSTSGNRMYFVTYNDLLIGGNGQDKLFVYDGSDDNITWELGACKAKVGVGTGITRMNISYKITIDVDAYICGAVSNVIGSVSNGSIELTHIPLGPIGTVNRKIYRKDDNTGGAWKLVDTIANNVDTTYIDTTADVSAANAIGVETDPIPKGSILKVHQERIFIAGDPNEKNKVYYSNPYLPHYIQHITNLDYLEVAKDDGDEIMGLAVQIGTLLCFKRNTIRKIFVSAASSGASSASWYAEDPIVFTGTPARDSIVQTPYGVVFLGWDRWYIFDGSKPSPIIDQFNTKKILPSAYNDVVCHWSKGLLFATFSDLETAAQTNDKIMVYNFIRDSFGLDMIEASCFSSHKGADESGDLHIGSSQQGFVYKAEETDNIYRLSSKTQCQSGQQNNTFVGGTESQPYIEIGQNQNTDSIPNDICIFWEDESTTPGPGWTEISGGGRMIKISTTAGAQAGSNSHPHSLSGSLATSTVSEDEGGDNEGSCTDNNHPHGVSAQNSNSSSSYPRHVKYRLFRKNSSTTEYEFPDGAIVLYSEPSAPEGWREINVGIGYYIRVDGNGLAQPVSSVHNHSFSIVSGGGGDCLDSGYNASPDKHSPCNHTHNINGSTESVTMDDWELDYVAFRFIKKIGETDTWDGTIKYVYALYYSAATPGNGWQDESAANSIHTHDIVDGMSEYHNGMGPGYGGYHHHMIIRHKHQYSLSAGNSGSMTEAPHITFRLFKKVLGQMKSYNSALTTPETNGDWTSPALQINAKTLKNIDWNATKGIGDEIEVYVRTGPSQGAVESAAWGSVYTISGANITETPDVWIQYKVEFISLDTTVSNPRIYFSDSYVVRFSYTKQGVSAENSVEFIYGLGFINFNKPMIDKILKKLSRCIGENQDLTRFSGARKILP